MHIISSVVLSRGPQNQHTVEQARNFLIMYRHSMVSIFKRQAKIGGVLVADRSGDLDELVDSYSLLITMTGFLEVSCISSCTMYEHLSNLAVTVRGQKCKEVRVQDLHIDVVQQRTQIAERDRPVFQGRQ